MVVIVTMKTVKFHFFLYQSMNNIKVMQNRGNFSHPLVIDGQRQLVCSRSFSISIRGWHPRWKSNLPQKIAWPACGVFFIHFFILLPFFQIVYDWYNSLFFCCCFVFFFFFIEFFSMLTCQQVYLLETIWLLLFCFDRVDDAPLFQSSWIWNISI